MFFQHLKPFIPKHMGVDINFGHGAISCIGGPYFYEKPLEAHVVRSYVNLSIRVREGEDRRRMSQENLAPTDYSARLAVPNDHSRVRCLLNQSPSSVHEYVPKDPASNQRLGFQAYVGLHPRHAYNLYV